MALLALCGEKRDLLVKEVRLSESAHEAVAGIFVAQETTFRDGEERPFDQNWKSEGNEISTTPIPADEQVFDRINDATDTTLPPAQDIEDIRGLAMKPREGGERILVQMFAPSQSLGRSVLSLILDEKGTFDRLNAPTFRLGDKLVCIVEDGQLKFRSLHNLGHVIDTSAIFRTATDQEVESFAIKYSSVFEIDDVSVFVDRTNRNARKYMASLEHRDALNKHTAESLQEAAQGTNLTIEINNGKIFMPNESKGIAELMQFLNDGRYVGPVSKEPLITNSRRPAT